MVFVDSTNTATQGRHDNSTIEYPTVYFVARRQAVEKLAFRWYA